MKVMPPLVRVAYVAIYVGGSIVFNYFLGILDYGGLPSTAGVWVALMAGGTIAGMLALATELVMYDRWGIWPAPVVAFVLRSIIMATVWLSLAYTLTAWLAALQRPLSSYPDALPVAHLAQAPELFFYMLLPAGLAAPFVGGASAILLLHAARRGQLSRRARPARQPLQSLR